MKPFLVKPSLVKPYPLLIFGLLAFFLSACSGWHLRGTGQNITLQSIDLKFFTKKAELLSEVNRVLTQREIRVDPQADIKLAIIEEEIKRRPLAYTPTGIAAQYRLLLTISYKRNNDPIKKITTNRNYDFNPSQITAKNEEQEALLNEMRRDLVRRMLVLISP